MIKKERNVPTHWALKRLGEICKLKNGFAFKAPEYISEEQDR